MSLRESRNVFPGRNDMKWLRAIGIGVAKGIITALVFLVIALADYEFGTLGTLGIIGILAVLFIWSII